MEAKRLLIEVSAFCRSTRMAESTFGRRAVNDGKFVSRLRYGGKVTTTTVERVRQFIQNYNADPALLAEETAIEVQRMLDAAGSNSFTLQRGPEHNFRFFDNRQRYLLFVNTCSEKQVIADRVSKELSKTSPSPPALRLFDAGTGDGTLLARVMRDMHKLYETYPFYVVGKEISPEDVRLAINQMPDRFCEHPATVLVMTNLSYRDAPWLVPSDPQKAARLIWHEVALTGHTAAEFEEQISGLQKFLAENWRAEVSKSTGKPVYENPAILIIYRQDHRFALESIIPRRGAQRADFDLVIASQPYRASAPLEFKAREIIAPLARALAPGGRLLGIHSHGHDPGLEIVQAVWPTEQPFINSRHDILKAVKQELGQAAHHYSFIAGSDASSIFRYDFQTLPGEIDMEAGKVGTSTLLAAWNAAAYVAQIEDLRLSIATNEDKSLRPTRATLLKHGGLWFMNESYVIARRPD